jgi:tRNA A37 N6-isopentenylltransferase MiaA
MNTFSKALPTIGILALVFLAGIYFDRKSSGPTIRKEYIVMKVDIPTKTESKKPATIATPERKEKIDSLIRIAEERDSLKQILADRLSEKKAQFSDSIKAEDSLGGSFQMLEVHSITYDGLVDSLHKKTDYKDARFKSAVQYIKEEMSTFEKAKTAAWLAALIYLALRAVGVR